MTALTGIPLEHPFQVDALAPRWPRSGRAASYGGGAVPC